MLTAEVLDGCHWIRFALIAVMSIYALDKSYKRWYNMTVEAIVTIATTEVCPMTIRITVLTLIIYAAFRFYKGA